MILETLRAWTDWLGHATHGVNALLAGVERDGGDAVPPNVLLIADETRNSLVARRQIPETQPNLMIRLARPVVLTEMIGPNTPFREAEVPVHTLYSAALTDTKLGNQNAAYTMRAVERSLAKLFDHSIAAANTARLRLNVSLVQVSSLQQLTTFEPIEDRDILAAMEIVFAVRDKNPSP